MSQYTYLSIDEIKNKINSLKKRIPSLPITNYYWQNKVKQDKFECITGNDSIFFFEKEVDFLQLYFYSINYKECSSILSLINHRPVILDYLTNGPLGNLEGLFMNSGFRLYAKMHRFRSNSIPRLIPQENDNKILEILNNFFANHPIDNIIHFALESDAENILLLLNNGLNKFIGHFPSLDDLKQLIKMQQILVVKSNSVITGLVIFKLTGKTCNFDHVYSDPRNNDLINSKLFFELYKTLNERGINFMYLWVEENNKKVINLHQRFGLKQDGLIDYVFIKD